MYWTVLTHFNILFASLMLAQIGGSLTEKTPANIPTVDRTCDVIESPRRVCDVTPRGLPKVWGGDTCVLTNTTMKCEIMLWSVCWKILVWYTVFNKSISSSSLQYPQPPSSTFRSLSWCLYLEAVTLLVKAMQIFNQTYNRTIVRRPK